jgi:tetratricopeptide (TPR) repeat protein
MIDAPPSEESAVTAALSQNWKDAIRINSSLLKTDEKNIDALNRLGFAYLQTGQPTQAKRCFQKVLTLDPYNQIALKNSKKNVNGKKKNGEKQETHIISPMIFLEEPGITKVAPCINLAPVQVLTTLSAGQAVTLHAKKHTVEIRDTHDAYLGALPDDLSFKLIKLLAVGNTYTAIIKSVDKKMLVVLIREISRSKKLADQPSFIATTSYVPFSQSDNANGDQPDTTATGEEEEEADKEE